jgi:4-amino-4-deoxy-L-arabinose transferase-like glycosyltransferase
MESDSVTAPARGPAFGLGKLLDVAGGSHARAAALLIGLSLAALLPGFFQIPPVDRDEARFAQATKQMVESGDYVDIRFQDEVRYKKPVGIYWLQTAAVKAGDAIGIQNAHRTIWLYRLPSMVGAIGAVLLTYWAALAFITRRGAFLAALMMTTSVLLGIEARLAKTDAMLLLTCVAAMGAMARVYLTRRRFPEAPIGWTLPAIFWTALAGGVLLKGPLILMFVALTALAVSLLDRTGRWIWGLKPIPGLIWMIALVLPWFVAIAVKSGDNFFAQSVGEDMLAKVASGQEAHGAPPGYYLVLFWITFWPGAVLAGLAAPAVWRARKEAGAQFLLAWLIPSWIVFEIVMTKLPHYVLPLYPAIAILIAGVLDHDGLAKKPWMVYGTIGWFLFPLAMALAALAGMITIGRDPGFLAWPFAAGAVIMGLVAWWLYEADGAERSLLRGMVASALVAITVYAVTFASLPALFPSAILSEELRDARCSPRVVAAAGYQEPSLVFLVGTDTRFVTGAAAADVLKQDGCRFAIVEGRSERGFVQRADVIGLRYTLIRRIEAYNISIGRPVTLSLFRSAETQ